MRDNIVNSCPMEVLSLNNFQTPYNNVFNQGKSVFLNVSSNVYYGYQPVREQTPAVEPMHVENSSKSVVEMDTSRCASHPISRKRTRDAMESNHETLKKRRQNEPPMPSHQFSQSPTKTCLEEDLLRETHGCSYYHWVSTNI